MNEFLKRRIERKLDTLTEERVYQVLDYIEFLESRYGTKTGESPSPLQRLAEQVEDTLRAGRVSVSAIRGTMDAISAAGRVMGGLAAAGKAVVSEVAGGNALPSAPAEAPPKPASDADKPPASADSA